MKITIALLRTLPGLDDNFLHDLDQIIGSEPIEFRESMERYTANHPEQVNDVVSATMALCLFFRQDKAWIWDVVRMAIVRLHEKSNLRHYAQTLEPGNWKDVYDVLMYDARKMALFRENTEIINPEFMNHSYACTYAAGAVFSAFGITVTDDRFHIHIVGSSGEVTNAVLDSIEHSVFAGSNATSADVNTQIIDICCKALSQVDMIEWVNDFGKDMALVFNALSQSLADSVETITLTFNALSQFLTDSGRAIVLGIARVIQSPPTMMRKKMRRYQRIVCRPVNRKKDIGYKEYSNHNNTMINITGYRDKK